MYFTDVLVFSKRFHHVRQKRNSAEAMQKILDSAKKEPPVKGSKLEIYVKDGDYKTALSDFDSLAISGRGPLEV